MKIIEVDEMKVSREKKIIINNDIVGYNPNFIIY